MATARDPYQVLGVDRGASEEEIKRAYRRLAKELHPDLHPGKPGIEQRFKEVTAAYHLLVDPERRARYDRGEIDAAGARRPEPGFYRTYADAAEGAKYHPWEEAGPFTDIDDLLREAFGRAAPGAGARARGGFRVRMPGADVTVGLSIGFLEAANGTRKRITLPHDRTVEVDIPAGLADGQVLRLKGEGLPGTGGAPAGDAFVEVHVAPHPHFRREGNDIHLRLPVTLAEAVLGARVRVPTISGWVSLSVPKGSNTGTRLRLKGKGIRDAHTGARGDQHVTLEVVLPESVDPGLERLAGEWARAHPYNPRRHLERQR